MSLDALFGGGRVDLTTSGYLLTFGLIVIGLPGLAAALFHGRIDSMPARIAVAASLVSLMTGSLACLVWVGVSIRAVGTTLTPAQVAFGTIPPAVTAAAAAWSRARLGRETADNHL